MGTLLERVLAGEPVRMSEIYEQNVRMILGRVKREVDSPCEKAGGSRICPKYCGHGVTIEADLRYAARLAEMVDAFKAEGN